jgi:hypothetical protein
MLLWTLSRAEIPAPHVEVHFEVAERPFGTYRLHPSPESTLGEPLPDHGHPASSTVVGPLADGDVPFRTWTRVHFDRLLYRLFNGKHGVGFALELVWPADCAPPHTDVGLDGTLAFVGTLSVSMRQDGRGGDVSDVTWSRGFQARSDATSTHVHAFRTQAPVHREGRYGPYHFVLHGTLSADLHLWAPAPE